jgi:CRP-like cAMP-binding protein
MDRLQILRSSELLQGISDDHCRRLDALAFERRCATGETLFRLGEEATSLYVVASGGMELAFPLLIMGEVKDVRFQTLEVGQALAWSALVPPHKLTMSARAAKDSVLLGLARDPLRQLFADDPALGLPVMSNLARVIGFRLHELQALWVREVQRNVSRTYR